MNKKEIIKKIELLFFDKSFDSVSMQDIATMLDIKKASLYYHFPSKKDMILEVIEESFINYDNFINEILEKWNMDNFLEILEDFLDFPDKNKNIFSIINQNWYNLWIEEKSLIDIKQKIIFDKIKNNLQNKACFTKEKAFLFLSIIEKLWNIKNNLSVCNIDKKKLLLEIKILFFN